MNIQNNPPPRQAGLCKSNQGFVNRNEQLSGRERNEEKRKEKVKKPATSGASPCPKWEEMSLLRSAGPPRAGRSWLHRGKELLGESQPALSLNPGSR